MLKLTYDFIHTNKNKKIKKLKLDLRHGTLDNLILIYQ